MREYWYVHNKPCLESKTRKRKISATASADLDESAFDNFAAASSTDAPKSAKPAVTKGPREPEAKLVTEYRGA